MTDAPFPPTCAEHIDQYDIDEVVEGYRSYRDWIAAQPGDNHSPAFRWGWANACRDVTGIDDGYTLLRQAHIHLEIARRT